MSKFLTGLVGILVVACLSVIGWALWELFHVNPRWAQLNSEQVAVWAAALATSLSALVTAGSFLFLYLTFRATRKQLDTAQEATELQKIAVEAQTRPFLELSDFSLRRMTGIERPHEVGVSLKVINHGQSPAVQVEVWVAALSADEVYRKDGRLLPISELRELVEKDVTTREGFFPGSQTWLMTSVGCGPESAQKREVFVTPDTRSDSSCTYHLFVRLKYQSFLNKTYDELRAFQISGPWEVITDTGPDWLYARHPLQLAND